MNKVTPFNTDYIVSKDVPSFPNESDTHTEYPNRVTT